MATSNIPTICFTCKVETTTYSCPGCSRYFCYDDLTEHRESLKPQFHEIENQRNEFMQILSDQQRNTANDHPLINQINQWEQMSIDKIRQTATEQRQLIQQLVHGYIGNIQTKLNTLAEEMQKIGKRKDFNEKVLNNLQTQLEDLKKQLKQPNYIEIKEDSSSTYINKLSIIFNSAGTTDTISSASSSSNAAMSGFADDFQAFQMRSVVRDFKLSVNLFASNGDIVLICGKGTQEKLGILLVSYEILSTTVSMPPSTRLLKVIKLNKKSVTQLETSPTMKIVLLLGDGIVSILDIDSLVEIGTISQTNVTLFSTWHEMSPSSSLSSSSAVIPDKLRICVAYKLRTLAFYYWHPQRKCIEENKDIRNVFQLRDTPCAIVFSANKMLIGYKKSYTFMSLETGKVFKEISFTNAIEPMMSYIPNRNEWAIQVDYGTIFLNSEFEPIYKVSILWTDIPTAIVRSGPYVLALLPQSIDVCILNAENTMSVQQITYKHTSSTIFKNRLWMDTLNERIYGATSSDVFVFEPTQTPVIDVNRP